MYIEKRWLVPAGLSLVLVGAIFAGALLLLGSRFSRIPVGLPPAQITGAGARSTAPGSATEAAPMPEPGSPVPELVATAQPASPAVGSRGPSPEEVVRINTNGSGATQINTRGFGDIGLQLQDVNIAGPVTFVHISNQGNNNSTNVNTGQNDRIVSDQRHLQSNRSDGNPPTAPAAAGARATRAVTGPPIARSGAGSQSAPAKAQHLRR